MPSGRREFLEINPNPGQVRMPVAQGGLDMQFLAARYSKGKKAVSEFADSRNRAVVFDTGCIEAHTDLLAYQAKACGKKTDPHLGQVERSSLNTPLPILRISVDSQRLQVHHPYPGRDGVAKCPSDSE